MVVDTKPQEKKLPVHKSIYLLPNLITALSMFMGILSLVWAVQSRFEEAGLAIVLSALLDGMDGKVARLTHTASEFGVQYDSLADLIAFGLAPAFLLWQWQLEGLGRFGVVVAFLFAACGALRLARFNISTAVTGKRFFIGLPIPAAGCTVVAFLYFAGILPEFFRPALTMSAASSRWAWACSWSAACATSPSRSMISCGPIRCAICWPSWSSSAWSMPSRACSAFCFVPSISAAASTILSSSCPVVTVSYYAP